MFCLCIFFPFFTIKMVSKGNARDFRENVFLNENLMYYKMSRISLSMLREGGGRGERERERSDNEILNKKYLFI